MSTPAKKDKDKKGSKRPLRLITLLSGTGMGGADILALDLSVRLRGMGHHVIFCCPPDNALIGAAQKAGLEIKLLGRQSATDRESLEDFISYCEMEKIDIVNAHHSKGRHFLSAARFFHFLSPLSRARFRPKIVFTRHCLRGGVPFTGFLTDNLACDLSVAVSNAVRKSFLLGGTLPGRIVTVHGGIEIKKFEDVPPAKIEEVREKYAKKRSSFNIGIVGRFHETRLEPGKPSIKRHEVLFRALANENLFRGHDINLLVVGPQDARSVGIMKEMARLNGLDESVITVCGFQEDVAPFYKIMDMNVLPSPREGLGLALVEAMAAGVPVIGADGGGIREIIADGVDGFLFRAGNSGDLAAKIKMLMNDARLRAEFSRRGSQKVGKLFDVEKNSKRLEDIFYGLISRT